MSTRSAPQLLPSVLAIALIAVVVAAVRYLLFEYTHEGQSVVLRLLQFLSP
jgi:hypothetical protein